jgi:desulfoferrodoxin (superoxide reductase-like protein)
MFAHSSVFCDRDPKRLFAIEIQIGSSVAHYSLESAMIQLVFLLFEPQLILRRTDKESFDRKKPNGRRTQKSAPLFDYIS